MKKISAILITILLIFSLVETVKAQDFNFDKAYQDYIFTQSQYSQIFSDYKKARDIYLKNPTLSLKEEARIKTLEMLRERDELQRVYLTALRLKLVEVDGLTKEEKDLQFERIDNEIEWYKNHKNEYKDSDPLETLFSKSKSVEDHYDLDTKRRTYDALFNISLGEVAGLRSEQEDTYSKVRAEIDKNVEMGKVKIDPFNRWFTDIEGTVNSLKEQEEKAKKIAAKIYTEGYSNPASIFKSAVAPFEESTNLLTQLNNYITELLNSFNSLLSAQK